jgi:uncharacterized protein
LIQVTESKGEVMFAVRVVPRSSRDSIEGEHGGALKVKLTAPPLESRANEALRRLLAQRLNVPLAAVRIVAGEKSRAKRVAIAGVTGEKVTALCSPPLKASVENHAGHSSNSGRASRQQN